MIARDGKENGKEKGKETVKMERNAACLCPDTSVWGDLKAPEKSGKINVKKKGTPKNKQKTKTKKKKTRKKKKKEEKKKKK